MLTILLAALRRLFHPYSISFAVLMMLAGTGAVVLGLWQSHNDTAAARLERAAVRAELLDSLQRAGELRTREARRQADTTLTHRYHRQATAADQLRRTDEALENRYKATRLVLPKW